MSQRTNLSVGILAFLLVSALIGIGFAYEGVPEGHEGVHKRWGAVTGQTYPSGANWVVPFSDSVQNVECRPRTYTMTEASGEGKKASRDDSISVPTNDGVEVDVDVTVRYRINCQKAPQFVEEWNNEGQVEARLIRPTVRSEIRNEGGAIPTSEIYTREGREQLRQAAHDSLEEEFHGEPLVLDSVQIRGVRPPKSYQNAVQQKEIKKQEVQQEEYEVQKAEKEKRRRIIQAEAAAEERLLEAEAEAEANRKIAESIDDRLVSYEFVKGLDRTDTVYFIGTDSNGEPLLIKNVDEEKDSDE